METTVPILIGVTALVLLCLGAIVDDRRARVRRRAEREPLPVRPLLHSINDDRCIGCEACVDVCPTEVLDLVEHKVRVLRFSDCVQCEQCANACPTQALVMYRQGTTPRMLVVPEIDEHFQTGVPGQYLIGEVAGKPLVKNAANLGRAVIEHIARELATRPAPGGGVVDVAIVGSGPGGLSAGLTCIQHRLSCVVLEKEHVLASTVSRYPKGKHFMAEPCTSRNVSFLPVFDGTKEELVAAWTRVVAGVQLPVKLGEAVETVARGDDGIFTIKTTVASYRARSVVLATGLRGKPRLLAVPGANLEKVLSLLDDPAEFAGEDVLVVGGGDSAVEGAIALAEAGARVTLSYRGDGFKRCKQGNQKRLAEMTESQRLAVLIASNVTCFAPGTVTIRLADGSETTIANQRAFVLIGADTPVAWLEANHVRFVERPHLYALGSSEDVVRRFVPDAAECQRTADDALAIVLGRHPARPSHHRMRSVAQHLRDEFREVVTSVSAAFRLSDLEPPPDARAMTRTPARGVAPIRVGDDTMIGLTPVAPGEHAAAAGPLRPRSHRRAQSAQTTMNATLPLPTVAGEITTDAVPSLRALEHAAGLAGTPRVPTVTPHARHSPGDPMGEVPRPAGATAGVSTPRARHSPIDPTGQVPRPTGPAGVPTPHPRHSPIDEIAALRSSLEAPTDETESLRAREQRAAQIAALRGAGGASAASLEDDRTEEVASLRALESAVPAEPPRRRRSTSNSVLTSAVRPPAAASTRRPASDRPAMPPAVPPAAPGAPVQSMPPAAPGAPVQSMPRLPARRGPTPPPLPGLPTRRGPTPPPFPGLPDRLPRGSETMPTRPPPNRRTPPLPTPTVRVPATREGVARRARPTR